MNDGTKPLTDAEQKYVRQLNEEAAAALRQLQTMNQRLRQCESFLREQHDTPVGEWILEDIQVGFVRVESKE